EARIGSAKPQGHDSRARFDSDPDDGREPRNGLVVQRPPKQARFWQMKGVWMSTCSGGPKKEAILGYILKLPQRCLYILFALWLVGMVPCGDIRDVYGLMLVMKLH